MAINGLEKIGKNLDLLHGHDTIIKRPRIRDKSLFFSHRRSTHNLSNITGRMINIIGFSQENIG